MDLAGERLDYLDYLPVLYESGVEEFVLVWGVLEFEPVVEELDGTEVFELEILEHNVVLLVVELLLGVGFIRGVHLEISESDHPALGGTVVDAGQRHDDPWRVDSGVDDVLLEP